VPCGPLTAERRVLLSLAAAGHPGAITGEAALPVPRRAARKPRAATSRAAG
jgi:hypothetical protein